MSVYSIEWQAYAVCGSSTGTVLRLAGQQTRQGRNRAPLHHRCSSIASIMIGLRCGGAIGTWLERFSHFGFGIIDRMNRNKRDRRPKPHTVHHNVCVNLGEMNGARQQQGRTAPPAPSTPAAPDKKLKILVLHGSRQDGEVFSQRLKTLVKKLKGIAVSGSCGTVHGVHTGGVTDPT